MRICTGGRKCCKHKGEEGSQKGHQPCERKPGPGHHHLYAVERRKLGVWVTPRLGTVKRHYVWSITVVSFRPAWCLESNRRGDPSEMVHLHQRDAKKRRTRDATQRYTGQRQDLTRVGKELAEARSGNLVGGKELRLIEKSTGWTYEPWWPRLSKQLAQPIALPGDLHS